jgi:hypothetical protein
LVSHFPHGLFFALVEECVVVVGVLHSRRDPAVWKSRR